MTSPEVQEHAIRTYCATAGHQLVDVVSAIDESGSRTRSPWWRRLDQAIAQVEAHDVDGIVVWKFSRVARHRLKWAVALDRVEAAGGVLESATEQFDATTSAGRFARGMTAEMNAFQAEMIGDTWREAHERRIREGLPHGGARKFGYEQVVKGAVMTPHPEEAAVVAEMYRRYIAGESPRLLATWLNNHGWRTVRGGLWSTFGVKQYLAAGFASGRIFYHEQLHPGVHEPLIAAEVWQSYLDQRAERARVPARRLAASWWLSGLVRCAKCGGMMIKNGVGESARLRCVRRRDSGPVGCVGTVVSLPRIEEHVLEFLHDVAGQVDASATDQAAVSTRRALGEVEGERLGREALKLDEALVRLVADNAVDPLPAPIFREARDRLVGERDRLAGALEVLRRELRREPADRRQVAIDLLASWDEWTLAGKRQIVGSLVDCVLVRAEPRSRSRRYLRVVEWSEVRS